MNRRWPLVAVVVLGVISGFFLPRFFIEPNVDIVGTAGEAAACVRQAYLAASTMVGGGSEVFINTGLRVVDVEPISPPPTDECPCPYRVTVQAYTWFGIPYDRFVADCREVRRVSTWR